MKIKSLNYLLFSIAAIFLFFFLINQIPLFSSDEGRYAEIAREALELKNFIVPHFNYLPFLDKPPIPSDLSALSFAVFGVNNLSARLIPILAALLGILISFSFVRKLFNKEIASLTAILLLTSIGYVLTGRFAVIDMLMTFFVSMSLFCLMTAYFRQKPKYYLIAYLFVGLSFLIKGLLGVILPGIVFLVFLLWTWNLGEIKRMKLGWGILIASLLVVPWCIIMSLKEPSFFQYFIIEQHFSRFATHELGRSKPFWFYIPIFIGVVFPWSFFAPLAFFQGLRQRSEDFKKVQFLITWFATIFLFFSVSKSKLPYYILPVSVPFAILTARFFYSWIQKDILDKTFRKFMVWTWRVLLFVGILAFIGRNGFLLLWQKISEIFHIKPFKPVIQSEIIALEPTLYIGSFVILIGIVLAFYFYKKNGTRNAILSLAVMIYLSLILTFFGMKVISPLESTYLFAKAVKSEIKKGDKVAIYASPDHFSDFIFYLKKRIIIAGEDRGTLDQISRTPKYEKSSRPYFMGTGDFAKFFNKSKERVFCLLDAKRISNLENYGLKDYKVLKKGYKKLLISNQ